MQAVQEFMSKTYGVVTFFGLVASFVLMIFGLFRWARHPWRWLIGAAVAGAFVGWSVFCFRQTRFALALDPRLPPLFAYRFWFWMWLFGVIGFTIGWLVTRKTLDWTGWLRELEEGDASDGNGNGDGNGDGDFADVERAWKDILFRCDQMRISPAERPLFLLLAPNEQWVESLIAAAELPIFLQAPAAEAPIHAYVLADAILLSCSGVSGLSGTPNALARMERFCARLHALCPDQPVLRGVAVLLPLDWAAQSDAAQRAVAVREDLLAIERTLQVRCPVYAMFVQMEALPGFAEFLQRMEPKNRQARCGFALPRARDFNGDLAQRGLTWMSGWFQIWSRNMMAGNVTNAKGNAQLWDLEYQFRLSRRRLREILEAAFTMPRQTDPVLLRGCYFLATGDAPQERGFLAGLMRPGRGRLFTEANLTDWSQSALFADQKLRRTGWLLILTSAPILGACWAYILRINPIIWIGMAPIILALLWIVTLWRLSRRPRATIAGPDNPNR